MKYYVSSTKLCASFGKLLWRSAIRKFQKPFALTILSTLVGLSILVGCNKAPVSPLRVATNLWPGYETFHLAQNLGYYNNSPIELVDLPSGTEEVRSFRNSSVEAAAISLDQALVLATTNPDVRIVTVVDFSEGGDVILAKPELSTLKALKGKRVGVEANALGAYIITRAMEIAGLTTQDITIVSLGLFEHERAFNDGTVDAVVTFGPPRTKLLSAGAKELFSSAQIPGEIVDVLVIREDVMTRQPDAAQTLVNGYFQALNYLVANPQKAAERIAPRTGVTPEQLLDSWQGLRSPNLQQNQKLLSKEDKALVKTAKRLVDIMVENKLLPHAIDPLPLLDDRLVNNIQL